MGFTFALAQCAHPTDADMVARIGCFARQAARAGADLLAFPEALMTRFDGSVESFAASAQSLDGPFSRAVDAIAADEGIWIAYTMNERNPDGLPFNTAVLTDCSGAQHGVYRKVHLFDAQGECESGRMAAGDALMNPVCAPFATIGLGICYDLRFPEVALAAALGGAQLMLYPAAWVSGQGKVAQWETLLRARAIENGMFVAGVGSVDEGRAGNSRVFAPDGTLVAAAGDAEQLLVCEIDLAAIYRTRAATPSLLHRRPECY